MSFLKNNNSLLPIGFGTGELGDDKEMARMLIKTAIRCGIRLIDTASAYGSEETVGRAVRELISDGEIKRKELFIQSKLAPESHGYQETLNCFKNTLEKTGLDYLDAYLIHWPVPRYTENTYMDLNVKSWSAMEELHREGKILALGVCNFLERHLLDILENRRISPTIGQLEIHPQFQQKGLCRFYRKQGIEIQAWGSIMNANNDEIKRRAAKYEKSPQQLCLRWSVQKGFVPLMASRNPEHIKQNIGGVLDFVISDEDMAALDEINTDTCYRDFYSYKRQRMY